MLDDFDLFGEKVVHSTGVLSKKFLVPPFSVFSARGGDWQERKRRWLSLGIQSEKGRGDNPLQFSKSAQMRPRNFARTYAQDIMRGEYKVGGNNGALPQDDEEIVSGTSVFDPVLCEIMYSWFCPKGGKIIDPFAGGSVRGVVASVLGYEYTGIDLRAEQVAANEDQSALICSKPAPSWIVGDSRQVLPSWQNTFDFAFSCPPYGDLERYSDDPRDLSTMDVGAFMVAYYEIISKTVKALRPDSFAVFVVGNYRDSDGTYVDLVGETVRAFTDAGARYHNEAVLVTSIGSLPVRVGRQFTSSKALGKTHQNILGFCKGKPKQAAKRIAIEGVNV